jgi:hypothetical protein
MALWLDEASCLLAMAPGTGLLARVNPSGRRSRQGLTEQGIE